MHSAMFRVVRAASHPFFIPAVILSFFVLIWVMSTANLGPDLLHHHHQRRLDAIFVLSGGHDESGQPPEWTVRRVEKAYELLVTSQGGGEPFPKIVCVGGGGTAIPPMLNEWGFWVPECSLCSKYLHEKKDVDYNLLLREYTSHDTLGNGFFSLLNHALPAGWTHLAIVTSKFHMPRAKVIFEYVYGLPGAGIGHGTYSKVSGSKAQGFFLEYHDVSDEGFNKTALQSRKELEKVFVGRLKALSKDAKTLQQLHKWMMVDNKQYNTAAQHLYGKPKPNATRETGMY